MAESDVERWQKMLRKPDWYLQIEPDFKRLEKLAADEPDYEKRKKIKEPLYSAVENALADGSLPLASKGVDFDDERLPIDTVIIHHTKNKPDMTLARLNAMHLLRNYGTYYARPADKTIQHIRGQAVWSGHFYKGQQVFWGYHYLVRETGEAEHVLDDKYIGWHAGNWNANTRSVGVCIDDDLTATEPSKQALHAIRDTIRNYPLVSAERVLGHCDVADTLCPGRLFAAKWRQELLRML